MATATQASPFRTAFSYLEPAAVFERKASSPYGLPIVDRCSACKLRGDAFFCALGPETIRDLDQIKHISSFPDGALVFVEGQAARGVYIVCQGSAKVMTTNPEGKSLILKIAGPGEILGLHAVIGGRPYEVTAETMQPCQLAFIGRDEFIRFLRTHGDACLRAAQHLSKDCQTAYGSIRAFGLSHTVAEKLATILLQWAADGKATDGVIRAKLALTHEEIAQLIGTTRETVTRVLGEFKKRQVAELKGATLLIRNKAALLALANS